MMRLCGIETEYGIARHDLDAMDPVVESMKLVRAYLTSAFERTWDYSGEDPRQDARGFRATGLAQDQEELEFAKADAHQPFSFYDMKSDLILPNGARFYNDHTHPEYSTPECLSLRDLLAHDRAGERVVQRAADRRNRALGGLCVTLYKNNTDFHGHSYGCHDNYLVSRMIPFPVLVRGLLPFLVSRQLVAGSGKVGVESQEGDFRPGTFQLSQRADFMETELSVDTMHNRPILNTRDEPHADRTRYRRLHLIVGDANMSEYATALKVGATRLVLDLIAREVAPDLELEHPVMAIKILSRDPDLKAVVRRKSGGTISGLELQTAYYLAAEKTLSGMDAETDWVLREWGETLKDLERDRARLVGRLDWVTKLWLLETFMETEPISWTDPWLASLDLEYHNVDPTRGLFLGLEAQGKTARLTTDADIQAALEAGPSDTRGSIRGVCVRRFRDQVASVQWGRVRFRGWLKPDILDLEDLFEPKAVQVLRGVLESAATPADAVNTWRAMNKEARS